MTAPSVRDHTLPGTLLASLTACVILVGACGDSPAAPNQSPTASFTSACTDLDCDFNASASSDSDGSVASYAWTFGDGQTGTGVSPSHSFAAGGAYTVRLTITDNDGATGTSTSSVTVATDNEAPTASFTSTCSDLDCDFDASASTDSDGTIASYAWTFGDGSTGTGSTPSHSYAAAGSYDVTLTVTDDGSATGDATESVTVLTSASMVQVGSVLAGEATFERFGRAVAISDDGSRIVVGVPGAHSTDNLTGSVRVYEWDGSDWTPLGQRLNGGAPSQLWGEENSISISGDGTRLAIGANRESASEGAVRVYELVSDTWTLVGSVITEADMDRFGISVSLSTDGSRVAVGATLTGTFGNFEGAFAAYQLTGGAWVQMGSEVLGEAEGDVFGQSIAMSGDGTRVVVGAPDNEGAGMDGGHLRIFDWSGAAWVQVGSDIDGPESGQDGAFGYTVSISQDGTRVAGHGGWNGDAARVFELESGDWVQMGADFDVPTAFETHQNVSLSADGSRLALGMPFGGPNNHGSIGIYDWTGSAWVLNGTEAVGPNTGDLLGWAVAITPDGSRVVVGAPSFDDGMGAGDERGGVFVFDVND